MKVAFSGSDWTLWGMAMVILCLVVLWVPLPADDKWTAPTKAVWVFVGGVTGWFFGPWYARLRGFEA